MDAKHTKGPWYASRLSEGVWIIKNETFDSYIALTHHREGVHADANASLIAAAPELLEALREIHNIAATPCLPENVSEDWPTVLLRRLGEIRHVSQKAVARAEGR